MGWVIAIGLLAALIGGVLWLRRHFQGAGLPAVPMAYEQLKPLGDAEQVLYWRLVEALPECVILSQVTFSRFMRPATGGRAPTAHYRVMQNRISGKSLDFLVCLKDFTVVAAVELDDATHEPDRDAQRDALLRAAGITPLRMSVTDIPTVERLREIFTDEEDHRWGRISR